MWTSSPEQLSINPTRRSTATMWRRGNLLRKANLLRPPRLLSRRSRPAVTRLLGVVEVDGGPLLPPSYLPTDQQQAPEKTHTNAPSVQNASVGSSHGRGMRNRSTYRKRSTSALPTFCRIRKCVRPV